MVDHFSGFFTSEDALTGIPEPLFRYLLAEIKDVNLLKLSLYLLWKAQTVADYGISFSVSNLMQDKIFVDGLNPDERSKESVVADLLESAAQENILLSWKNEKNNGTQYFINCDAGKSALAQAEAGTRSPTITLDQIQPKIYKMYEENIGPLTPLIADALRVAEKEYPGNWILEAMELAVKNNVRRWRYVESILDRWQKEGRHGTDRKNNKTDYRSYLDD